ncbi:MAG: hypothetical protein M3238_02055 [Actinomycetota bacterium]|nr:hypothetical protein [Actinomycetota bacterium]
MTALLLAMFAIFVLPSVWAPAYAAPNFAQEDGVVGEEDETSEQDGEGAGQGDPEAETGADEGETAEGATEEGPPWTYQMARLGIVLLIGVAALIGLMYRKMIVLRQRGEV